MGDNQHSINLTEDHLQMIMEALQQASERAFNAMMDNALDLAMYLEFSKKYDSITTLIFQLKEGNSLSEDSKQRLPPKK